MQGREVGCWVNSLWTSSIDCAESGWRLSLPTSVSIELAERAADWDRSANNFCIERLHWVALLRASA